MAYSYAGAPKLVGEPEIAARHYDCPVEETLCPVVSHVWVNDEKPTGVCPKGWLGPGLWESWDTLDILADEGISYICDWCNDDQPFVMNENGRNLVAVQYLNSTITLCFSTRSGRPKNSRT